MIMHVYKTTNHAYYSDSDYLQYTTTEYSHTVEIVDHKYIYADILICIGIALIYAASRMFRYRRFYKSRIFAIISALLKSFTNMVILCKYNKSKLRYQVSKSDNATKVSSHTTGNNKSRKSNGKIAKRERGPISTQNSASSRMPKSLNHKMPNNKASIICDKEDNVNITDEPQTDIVVEINTDKKPKLDNSDGSAQLDKSPKSDTGEDELNMINLSAELFIDTTAIHPIKDANGMSQEITINTPATTQMDTIPIAISNNTYIAGITNPNMNRNLANIYILLLNQDKYYIGRSYIPQNRIDQHRVGKYNAAKWVKLWGFNRVINILPEQNMFEEDYLTKIYMHKYGIEHVRGGTYFSPRLMPNQLELLQKEFDSALHRCFKCGDLFTRHHKCDYASKLIYCYYCLDQGHRMKYCPKLLQMLQSKSPNNMQNHATK